MNNETVIVFCKLDYQHTEGLFKGGFDRSYKDAICGFVRLLYDNLTDTFPLNVADFPLIMQALAILNPVTTGNPFARPVRLNKQDIISYDS